MVNRTAIPLVEPNDFIVVFSGKFRLSSSTQSMSIVRVICLVLDFCTISSDIRVHNFLPASGENSLFGNVRKNAWIRLIRSGRSFGDIAIPFQSDSAVFVET